MERSGGGLRLARMLFWSMFAGIALFGGVAVTVLARGQLAGVFSPSPLMRSAAALVVGLGCFAGLRVCRGAYAASRSRDPANAVAYFQNRSILGWGIIEGLAFAGICFGMLAGSTRQIVILAGFGLAAMFLARPVEDRLPVEVRRSRA